MRKMMILIMILLPSNISAGIHCLDNTQNLRQSYDTKSWNLVDCNCPCSYIKNGICAECLHRQEAQPLAVIETKQTSITQPHTIHERKTIKEVFNNLIQKYMEKNNS